MSEPYPRTIEPRVSKLLVSLPSDNPIAGDAMSAARANEFQRNCGKLTREIAAPWRSRAVDSKLCSFALGNGR
jgi:hypothetical protein